MAVFMNPISKVCRVCSLDKIIADFYPAVASKDGYQSRCKVCEAKAKKEQYKRDSEKIKARKKEFYQKNRQYVIERQKQYVQANKENRNAQRRESYIKNRERILEQKKANWPKVREKYVLSSRLKKYGITKEHYEDMLKSQDNKCKICDACLTIGQAKNPSIDHCHSTGYVRGLLCNLCNVGLGAFKDNTASLAKAIEYITINNARYKK